MENTGPPFTRKYYEEWIYIMSNYKTYFREISDFFQLLLNYLRREKYYTDIQRKLLLQDIFHKENSLQDVLFNIKSTTSTIINDMNEEDKKRLEEMNDSISSLSNTIKELDHYIVNNY